MKRNDRRTEVRVDESASRCGNGRLRSKQTGSPWLAAGHDKELAEGGRGQEAVDMDLGRDGRGERTTCKHEDIRKCQQRVRRGTEMSQNKK